MVVASSSGLESASFEAVLSSLRREYAAGALPEAAAWPQAAAFFLWDGAPIRGFASSVASTFEDFVYESPRPAPARTLPSDRVDAITAELALSQIVDRSALQAARRRFMWSNHPDRRPDLPRELANRRVAIANMLIDRALRLTRPDS